MLDECLEYLERHTKSGFTYEVIVVNDGSTDKTRDVAQKYASKYNTVRVLNLVKNRGKGGAVRMVSIFHTTSQSSRQKVYQFYWKYLFIYCTVDFRAC